MNSSRPRVILSEASGKAARELCESLGDRVEIVSPGTPGAGDGVLLVGGLNGRQKDVQLCMDGYLDTIPDGLVLINSNEQIVWHNQTLLTLLERSASLVGQTLFEALDHPELVAPQSVGLHPEASEVIKAVYKIGERRFLALRASNSGIPSGPVASEPDSEASDEANTDSQEKTDQTAEETAACVLTSLVIRDVSEEVLENQKREAIYQAGLELGDLSPDEITDMSHEDRTDLLKEKILDYSQDILGFETIEIRVLNPVTRELIPLLEEGMQPEAASRRLFAEAEGNGVTGWVAANSESHLCHDTLADPLYLSGAADARSSLTVPLVMHEEVLGTFNVESPGKDAFDHTDLEFLNVFGHVVAMAINQLQLLVAEQIVTANENTERLRRDVAIPADDIISSATALLERYIGHDPAMCEQLQGIVDKTRSIRDHISRGSGQGEHSETDFRSTASRPRELRPALRGKRLLVVDSDETVLKSAHELLECHNCVVETVRSGAAACQMARGHHYDVVIADIRLPDMNGYECFCSIREIDDRLPIILMTGFGYDAGHTIVKSRQAGLKSVLYKPFRREQLLTEVEKAVTPPPAHE
ncbi:MAG: response regulator [Planctomycetaceae bacterium]|nr:response regulator [Planctomycetaceae bacterium]